MRFIPTKIHGVLDYITVVTGLALPYLLNWNRDATILLNGAALAVLLSSLITRYELSVVRWLPMKGHLMLDALNGALLIAAPLLWLKEDTTTSTILIALGITELVVVLLSKTHSPVEDQSYTQDRTSI